MALKREMAILRQMEKDFPKWSFYLLYDELAVKEAVPYSEMKALQLTVEEYRKQYDYTGSIKDKEDSTWSSYQDRSSIYPRRFD